MASQNDSQDPSAPRRPPLSLEPSRFLADWLRQQRVGLALTTYQIGKLFLIGLKSRDVLSVFERTFDHCMGLCASPDAQTIWLSSRYQIWRLEGAPTETARPGSEDNLSQPFDIAYVPQVGYTTGHVDVHDMAPDADGRLIFVNTLFSCLATLSETASFRPLWRPPWVTALAPEDRCHLNGMAMRDGRPAFVTAIAPTDAAGGWRDRRRDGGCVVDVASGETVVGGLSMPHSPRWHAGQLWLLNSGTGEIGRADVQSGRFEPVAFCPGYLRGLAIVGDFAVVTLSKPRYATFHGLPLEELLARRRVDPQCGLQVIDLSSGQVAHRLRLEGDLVTELYDVAVLRGIRRPLAFGFQTTEIERLIRVGEPAVL